MMSTFEAVMEAAQTVDMKNDVEGHTRRMRENARWSQGYKTGVQTEYLRIRGIIRQLERDFGDVTAERLLDAIIPGKDFY